MALAVVSQDYWSEMERCTIRERCKLMFNNELLSDVKFVVRDTEAGSESMKTIPAHKFVLAISSPVFYAMFYGELAETKDSINISDCEYRGVLELFRFIYSDEVHLNADNVMQVLYLAKKYMFLSLVDKCMELLGENVDASNVFHVLQVAQKYEAKELVEKCWKVIDEHGDEAVKAAAFATVEKSLLEELVERDSLKVTEVELFKAVDCWAGHECEKKNLALEGSVKRRVLGERIVGNIRFPVMEEKEFVEVVLDCEILTPKEAYNMMKYFNGVLPNLVGFLESKRSGPQRGWLDSFKNYFKPGVFVNYIPNKITCTLSVNKTIELQAVRLFGSEDKEYDVELILCDNYGLNVATVRGTFSSIPMESDMGNYHGFDVIFEPAPTVRANKSYTFTADFKGSASCYGKGKKFDKERTRRTSSFRKSTNIFRRDRSDVAERQFAEFAYKLK
ncbi:BTB/POZ domain-containing protein 6-like [Stylophora pistillata]|uniref:BTB/POZ domain-containing protein 6-like n=1 Tax=Stylophora pistillata TaxID=50429 RepID=UPI000C04A9AD|nr:BTB/POZ domain-containing protein 6-like [Stylophora pistillata]